MIRSQLATNKLSVWGDREHVTVFVVDQSASMGNYTELVRNACRRIKTSLQRSDIFCYFIAFSNEVDHGESLELLQHINGGTSIGAAFDLLAQLVSANRSLRSIDVVFVSDGEDNDRTKCNEILKRMHIRDLITRLFCVGIFKSFPSELVMNYLYPVWGKNTDKCLSPIVPLDKHEDVAGVFEQIEICLRTVDAVPVPVDSDFDSARDCESLLKSCQHVSIIFLKFSIVFFFSRLFSINSNTISA